MVPVKVAAGKGFTVTLKVGVKPVQPFELVNVQINVLAHVEGQFTLILQVPCPEVILPPVTAQLYPVIVPPEVLLNEYVPVEFKQEVMLPAIIAVGEGLITIPFKVADPLQFVPVLVTVTVTEPIPAAPQMILTVFKFNPEELPEKVPPPTDQL